ncbi:neuraminidase [Influenza A virus (A/Hong Kong/1-1-MA-12/1968(H3N2))]|uniref:Neuraminidase n=10 Tax=H3N2 subtype TaxID=119210 RepID=Q910S0_I68A4|nr:neuraminidase [Influenza A virus (A/Hong Kong/1/1968(H3N2))]ACF41738.1 neuraminidase [Influenza A virus (A/Hong Kong/1-1-MA-12/1968(H3N2))]ACI25749.1 neuraminidase [Influenza A virus (A/Hong Kong/1-1-MA-12A/1968(H3N2))]ACI25760.1 neuraminidase [Influenza A virus (A/Hong Kong/1-1-MA-12B/1968(H3N2))]ACI25771.1 neuraminidase [Influenza A virus (A/Hong Kong/1-1-MA-12C/1968(H3N2))]ACU79885.1 neuraminidase [Influenza A virus (A/Hong Kong/1-1-MA-20/1968(H3N2))]ACV49504.1 neuraminidase [Influenza 
MNPNQKIITIGSVSLTIATVCFLMQIAILVTTVTLHFKQYECDSPASNQVMPCEPIIIERNITEIVYLNNTTIEKEICPKVVEYRNWSKPQCQITGFAPFSKDNSIRLSAGGDIWVTREPYVSCDHGKCYQFALGQGTTLDNKHSNDTIHDRIPHRTLLMNELGVPFHLGTRQVCIAWSSSSCHDGKAWLHVCITGDDKNATASFIYDGRLVDSIGSWSQNILRTQESECVCINGTCTVVMTDGSASGRADTRILFIEEGKIVHISPLSGSAQHVEECSCYPRYPGVRCICRDNWKGSNRPVVDINMEDYSIDSSYVCSGLVGDTPRNDDRSSNSNCRNPNNERGNQGVKGWAFDNGDDVWMGRTISKDLRSGYETFKVIGGWSTPNSKSQINRQVIVDSDNRSGYSGIFSVEGKSCINRCFYVELIRGRKQETRVWWTSNSIVVFCGTSGTYGTGSWPDGANINFMHI